MFEWLLSVNMDNSGIWIWTHWWDCGILNWYKAALLGKAIRTNSGEGFKHFFAGRKRPPSCLDADDYQLIEQYMDKT